ncbi:MAG: hypothetical protein NZ108_01530, partial [Bacteroidia bacterium]|nr:hypothetical protein [Bacteroidia bacterium]
MPGRSIPQKQLWLFYSLIGCFLVLVAIALWTQKDINLALVLAIPFGIAAVYALLFETKHFLFLLCLCLPLSFNLENEELGFRILFPSEFLTVLLAAYFIFRQIIAPNLSSKYWLHPISLLILFHLSWTIFTTFFSSMPIVSIKFTIVKTCYIIVFYFLIGCYLTEVKDIIRSWTLYGYSLI